MRSRLSAPPISWAALAVSILALVIAMSGVGFAAGHGASGPAGQVVRLDRAGQIPASELPKLPARDLPRLTAAQLPMIPADRLTKVPAAALPRIPANLLTKVPASALPPIKSVAHADTANKVGGKSESQLAPDCRPGTVDIGTWCLDRVVYALSTTQAGQNDYAFATRTCEGEGGWLPSAGELLGAADKVPLESVLTDSTTTATTDVDPTNGLSDLREMSSTLVTIAAGSDAAGSEGVSDTATGNPVLGAPNPTPLPAVPFPETLQYVTVYDNHQQGGFAGSEPVSAAENFRCAFAKIAPAGRATPKLLRGSGRR